MGCYECGGTQGTAARLCPACIARKRATQESNLKQLEQSRLKAKPEVRLRLVEPGEDRSPALMGVCGLIFFDLFRSMYRVFVEHPLLNGALGGGVEFIPRAQEVLSFMISATVLVGAWRQERWVLWAYTGFFLVTTIVSIVLLGLGGITKFFLLSILWPAVILIVLWMSFLRI